MAEKKPVPNVVQAEASVLQVSRRRQREDEQPSNQLQNGKVKTKRKGKALLPQLTSARSRQFPKGLFATMYQVMEIVFFTPCFISCNNRGLGAKLARTKTCAELPLIISLNTLKIIEISSQALLISLLIIIWKIAHGLIY
jgi:hypothetical protein